MPTSRALSLLGVLCGALLLSACNKAVETEGSETPAGTAAISTAASDQEVVATVNGEPVTKQALDAYRKQRETRRPVPETKQGERQLLEELINFEIVVQHALSKGLDDDPQTEMELATQRRNVLAGAAFRDYLESHPLSDEDLRKDYSKRMAEVSFTEYNVQHILTESEEDARKIVDELGGGADFAELARQKSMDQSAEAGGDLGWLRASELPPAFRQAVTTMDKAGYTKEPVQTQFGWHIVRLADIRDVPPPPFEEVKERVRSIMQRKQIQDYLAGLRQQAKVELKGEFAEQAAEATEQPEAMEEPAEEPAEAPAEEGEPES